MNIDAADNAARVAEAPLGTIPWDVTASRAANAMEEISRICTLFDESGIMQLAFSTLVGELLHAQLVWKDKDNKILPTEEVQASSGEQGNGES